MSAGAFHTVGLKADGSVVAAGSQSNNQCDIGDWSLPQFVFDKDGDGIADVRNSVFASRMNADTDGNGVDEQDLKILANELGRVIWTAP